MKPTSYLSSLCILTVILLGARAVYHFPNPRRSAPVAQSSAVASHAAALIADSCEDCVPDMASETTPTENATRVVESSEIAASPDEMREWARDHPGEALSLISTVSEGPLRDAVAETVCLQLAQTNLPQAIGLAERFGGNCRGLMENLVQQWAERDEPAALAYVANQPSGEGRDRFLSRVVFSRAKKAPAEAANLAARQIPPGEIQNEAVISVIHQWALRDGRGAMAWAHLFPDGELRNRAIEEVTNGAAAASGG